MEKCPLPIGVKGRRKDAVVTGEEEEETTTTMVIRFKDDEEESATPMVAADSNNTLIFLSIVPSVTDKGESSCVDLIQAHLQCMEKLGLKV